MSYIYLKVTYHAFITLLFISQLWGNNLFSLARNLLECRGQFVLLHGDSYVTMLIALRKDRWAIRQHNITVDLTNIISGLSIDNAFWFLIDRRQDSTTVVCETLFANLAGNDLREGYPTSFPMETSRSFLYDEPKSSKNSVDSATAWCTDISGERFCDALPPLSLSHVAYDALKKL